MRVNILLTTGKKMKSCPPQEEKSAQRTMGTRCKNTGFRLKIFLMAKFERI